MESQSRLWSLALLALLACTASVPFAASVFPTQDGPVHLYYADLLRGVLTHSAPYAQHFEIKRLVTPYALESYALLALETLFSAALSEKLLVVCYIFTFGLGFRYLVESVAERGSPWILAGLPFCLNMLLYMGFLNYCFAVALLLFECGLWVRYYGALTKKRTAALCGGLVLMLFTHPVPVMVFLLFAGVHFLCDRSGDGRSRLALMFAMAVTSLTWIGLFVDRGQGAVLAPNHASTWGWFDSLATELQLYPVAPFTSLSYRAGPILLAAFACAALMAGIRHTKRPATVTLVATSAICFLLFCVVPERVSGAYYFAERFPIVWILFLLAAASTIELPRAWKTVAGATAAVVTAVVLTLQWSHISAIGAQLAAAQDAPPAVAGEVGLIIGHHGDMPDGLAFNPYLWNGVHYFRRSRAILANEPWMEMPIMLLRPTHPDRWSFHDPDAARQEFETDIGSGSPLQSPDFVLVGGPADRRLDNLMKRSGWNEKGQPAALVRIYRRQ